VGAWQTDNEYAAMIRHILTVTLPEQNLKVGFGFSMQAVEMTEILTH